MGTTEEWRPVLGWEGRYEVSDQGRVRSLTRRVASGFGALSARGGNLLNAWPAKDGYLDGNPVNNALTNLAWSTHAENIRDKRRHGTSRWALARGYCKQGHPFDAANTYIHPRTGSPTCRTCRRDGMRAATRKKATA